LDEDNRWFNTISVSFERFPALKELIEQRSRWYELDAQCDYFETPWKPTCQNRRHAGV